MIAQEHGYYPTLGRYLKSLPMEMGGLVLRSLGIVPLKRGRRGVWGYREGQGWTFYTYGYLLEPPHGSRPASLLRLFVRWLWRGLTNK